MQTPSRSEIRGRWRRRLFWAWTAASAVVGAYIGIAGPVSDNLGAGVPYVALAVPPLMFFMLSTGIAWLVLLVMPARNAGRTHTEKPRTT